MSVHHKKKDKLSFFPGKGEGQVGGRKDGRLKGTDRGEGGREGGRRGDSTDWENEECKEVEEKSILYKIVG